MAQQPTVQEQLLLELVNRARLDPAGEAARFGIPLNQGLVAGTLSGAAKQPLAPNEMLVEAARGHSAWMIANDVFSHTGAGGSSPHQRMQAAGYLFGGSFGSGENLAIRGTSGAIVLTSMTVQMHQDLFLSKGHRVNMLNASYRELGTGIASGVFVFPEGPFNSATATENFAFSGSQFFITGVCINDADGDNFYDIGEQRPGIDIDLLQGGVPRGSDISMTAGGYAIGVAAGTYDLVFDGGDLAAAVNVQVNAASGNAKVDLAGQNEVLSSASITLGDGAVHATLLGVANINATGNNAANTLLGNKGANVLSGLNGNDNLIGGAGNDRLIGGLGTDQLTGGAGRDIMTGDGSRDVFDFNAASEIGRTATTRDRITDFLHGTDDIDLSTIDAVAGGPNNAFRFIGRSAFSGQSGQLHFLQQNPAGTVNDKTIIEGDLNGDRVADFQLELTGLIALTAGDFIL